MPTALLLRLEVDKLAMLDIVSRIAVPRRTAKSLHNIAHIIDPNLRWKLGD
jgi:hypothetical protein